MTRLPILLCLALAGCAPDDHRERVVCTDSSGAIVAQSAIARRWSWPYKSDHFGSDRSTFAPPPGTTCDVREVAR